MDHNNLFENENEDEEIEVNSPEALASYKYEVLKKANSLIGLKYKASVIENKLTYAKVAANTIPTTYFTSSFENR